MPRYDKPALKAAILARVAAGETVAAIGRSGGGAPCEASIVRWARGDPGFRAELDEARRRGAWLRRFAFDEAVARAFLLRMANGERVADVLGQPWMPSRAAYRHWRRTQGEFAAALARIKAGKYSQRSRTGHPRWRAWDEAVADRLLLAAANGAPMRRTLATDPAFPALATLARWRAEHSDWNAALKLAMRVGRTRRAADRCRERAQALEDAVGLKVLAGGSLRALGERDPGLPCARTLYAWRRRWPSFARAMEIAMQMRADLAADLRVEAVLGEGGGPSKPEGDGRGDVRGKKGGGDRRRPPPRLPEPGHQMTGSALEAGYEVIPDFRKVRTTT